MVLIIEIAQEENLKPKVVELCTPYSPADELFHEFNNKDSTVLPDNVQVD
jgi:hypothetical protein